MYIIEKAQDVNGEVFLSGSKNSALPILLATLLCNDNVVLNNVPLELNDINIAIDLLQDFGSEIKKIDESTIEISNHNQNIRDWVPENANQIRSSLLLLSIILNIT